jgi:hypothetical protein
MIDVPSIAIGAITGYFANYFIERFKRRSAIKDFSRKAYAAWFTAEALILRRVDTVCNKLVGFPTDRARHEALMVEVRSLAEDGRTLITTMNEAFLTEQNRRMRTMLSRLHKHLVGLVETLEFAARHYYENLELHEHFDCLTEDDLPEAEREEYIALKEEFKKHDASCPFKSSKFQKDLREYTTGLHKIVEEVRDRLAVGLSR